MPHKAAGGDPAGCGSGESSFSSVELRVGADPRTPFLGAGDVTPPFEVSRYTYEGADVIHVRAGHRGVKRVVPPAGEEYAFDVDQWARRVEVYVSPKGRSVRVWVDGVEIPR